jgi:hypothetical protein
MSEQSKNQGEGNREADRRYREQTQKFVQSERGKQEIARAGEVSDDEARDIEAAEEEARGHAKEEDPNLVRDPSKPSRS